MSEIEKYMVGSNDDEDGDIVQENNHPGMQIYKL